MEKGYSGDTKMIFRFLGPEKTEEVEMFANDQQQEEYYGLTNIGTRPTVDIDANINMETHLLHFDGDLYQKELRIEFLDYIRPEQRFESKEALQKQIQHDIKAVEEQL